MKEGGSRPWPIAGSMSNLFHSALRQMVEARTASRFVIGSVQVLSHKRVRGAIRVTGRSLGNANGLPLIAVPRIMLKSGR